MFSANLHFCQFWGSVHLVLVQTASMIIFSMNFAPKPNILSRPSENFAGFSHTVSFFMANVVSRWKYNASFMLVPSVPNASSKASIRILLNSPLKFIFAAGFENRYRGFIFCLHNFSLPFQLLMHGFQSTLQFFLQ